jgi:Fe-S cluster assembly protein SufD
MENDLQGLCEQQYIGLYEQARQTIFSHAPEAMNVVRDEAFAHFKAQGFPSRKVERYKYTDVRPLFAPDYGVNLSRLAIPVDPYQAFRCDVPNLSTQLFFVVNDAFHGPAATVPDAFPSGLVVGSLRDHPDIVGRYYARLAPTNDDAITALNTMLAQDGLLVYVPRGVRVDRAVQIINILKATPQNAQRVVHDLMVNRRVLIVLEEGAALKLLFCDHTADDRQFLTTQVTEAFVGQGAQLELYCLEETHQRNVRLSNVYIDQQRDSRVTHNVITLHNGVTRNKLDLNLSGEGAQCDCYGCVIADKQQHVDNNTLITHRVPHCTSNELYKYVLDGSATGAFAGRVLVEQGAQQTASQMTNQNLCASAGARMYTQPMLEIYADDVKCAHGSTVGQLNDQALFYMQQRGIPEQEARTLLEVAFINQVIDHIELTPLRDRLHYLVEKRFRGELNKCEGCKLCH